MSTEKKTGTKISALASDTTIEDLLRQKFDGKDVNAAIVSSDPKKTHPKIYAYANKLNAQVDEMWLETHGVSPNKIPMRTHNGVINNK
jgi:hypothetical protein